MASSGVFPVASMTSTLSWLAARTTACTEIPQRSRGVSSPASCIISLRYQALRSGYSSVRAASPRQSSANSCASLQAWQASIASSRQAYPCPGSGDESSAGGIRGGPPVHTPDEVLPRGWQMLETTCHRRLLPVPCPLGAYFSSSFWSCHCSLSSTHTCKETRELFLVSLHANKKRSGLQRLNALDPPNDRTSMLSLLDDSTSSRLQAVLAVSATLCLLTSHADADPARVCW